MKLKELIKKPISEQEEILLYIGISKPKNKFKYRFKRYVGTDIEDISYKDVDHLKRLFFNSDIISIIEIIKTLYKCTDKVVLNLSVEKVIPIIKSISDQFEKIIREESKLDVFSEPKIKMALKMAGSEAMNQFGITNTIDSLSNGNKELWSYFENLPYHKVRYMIMFNTVGNMVNKNFQKAINNLNKI